MSGGLTVWRFTAKWLCSRAEQGQQAETDRQAEQSYISHDRLRRGRRLLAPPEGVNK